METHSLSKDVIEANLMEKAVRLSKLSRMVGLHPFYLSTLNIAQESWSRTNLGERVFKAKTTFL